MTDVSVTFGAETAGVTAGGAAVKGVLAGIQDAVTSLGAMFKGMGDAAVAGFDKVTSGAEEASTSLKEMRDTGMEVKQAVRGIGEAMPAAFAVHELDDLAHKLADTAEAIAHTATTFDLTTNQVQALRAQAAGLGISFDAILTAMQRSDRALTTAREGSKQAAEAFKVLGINIHEPIDQATLLQKEIAGLANISDVPTRVGLAMQLFGRNIQQIAPLIGATKEQISAVSAATQKYGAVNAEAQAKGAELADAFNLQKVELQGLGLTLTAELAPTLTKLVTDITGLLESFRQWASQGDNLKNMLTGLTIAAAALASVLGIGALTAAIEGVAALLGGIFLGAIQLATAGMVEFDVAADANPIGALVLAIEALVAGLVLLYMWLDRVGVFKAIGDDMAAAWNLAAASAKLVGDALQPVFAVLGNIADTAGRLVSIGFESWWGKVKTQIDFLVESLRETVDLIGDFFSRAASGLWNQVAESVGGLKGKFDELNTGIGDVLTSVGDVIKVDFPGVAKTWDTWLNTLQTDANNLAGAFDNFWAAASGRKSPGPDMAKIAATMQDTAAAVGLVANAATAKGKGDAVPNIGGGGKHGDAMEAYRTKLAQNEDEERTRTQAWLADLSQMDLDYWNNILEHAKLSAKDREEIDRTVAELKKKINGEAQSDILEADRAKISADKGNTAALTTDWQNYVDDTVKASLAGSREVKKAQIDMVAALKAADRGAASEHVSSVDSMVAAATRGADASAQADKTASDEAERALKQRYDTGQISSREYYTQLEALQRQSAKAQADAIQAGLIAELAAYNVLLDDANLTEKQRQDILAAEVAAEDTAAKKIATIWASLNKELASAAQQQQTKFEQQWDKTVGSLTQTFAQGLLKMAQGGESFSQLMRGIGQKILTDWVNGIAKMVSDWARSMVMHLAVTNTTNAAIVASNQAAANANLLITLETNLKKGLSDAVAAAQGAYAWAAGWGGPIAGAIAAAAAFAGTMAFEGAASAEGGYDIPAGVNPLTQLHAQEMVLPAHLANPMRSMLADYGQPGNGPWGGGAGSHSFSFGDTHIHGAPNMSPSDFKSALAEHRSNVAEAVAGALRGGWRPSYKQPVGAL